MATSTKKTTKKTTQKTTKKSDVKQSPSLSSRVSSLKTRFPAINPVKITIVLIIIGVALLLYFFQDKYLFAKVNGKPLTTFEVLDELEKVKRNEVAEVVNIMIDKSLLLQEAEKRGITVSEEEINQEMKKTEEALKQSGQSLDSQLALLGMTREGLRENYQIQKSVEKMIGTTEVSEEEINNYIEQNKDLLPPDQDEKQLREMVKQQLSQQKLGEQYQKLITELRANADIQEFRPYLNQAAPLQ